MSTVRPTSEARVDLGAYAHNLRYAAECAGPELGLVAVVKADGYGLGAAPLARRALECGAAWLGVATVGEAEALRLAGIQAPILVLMQPEPENYAPVIDLELSVMLSEPDGARALGEAALARGKTAPVHAMVDTGMGRQGFGLETAFNDIQQIAAMPGLRLEGIATHYPVADFTGDPFTAGQIGRLKALVAELRAAGLGALHLHGANSAGIVDHPDALYTLVRPGIMCMGVWPTDTMPEPNPIRPVLRWVTRVAQVRTLAPGHSISYGRTYIAEKGMAAAMLPIGYADGYRIAFSNRAEVLIRGIRCPVRGRVCMDQTVVDVSHVPEVQPGEEVVLAGTQGDGHITLEELAAHASTIPYEILTGIGRRVARIHVN